MPGEESFAVVYAEGLRMVAGQEAALDSVRSRAGTLISAASVATAFLGAEALKREGALDHWWGGRGATASFAALTVAVILLLLPYSWTFFNDPKDIICKYGLDKEDPPSTKDVQRDLALRTSQHYGENQKKLNLLFLGFTICCALLALEIGLWIVELTRGR